MTRGPFRAPDQISLKCGGPADRYVLLVLIASQLSEVLPLIGVVIGGALTIAGQFVLAWIGRNQRRRVAARLFHTELAGLVIVLQSERTKTISETAKMRYQDVLSTWREYRDALSTVDEGTWSSLWLTMQTLNSFFSMPAGPTHETDRAIALSATGEAARAIAAYSKPRGTRSIRRCLNRLARRDAPTVGS